MTELLAWFDLDSKTIRIAAVSSAELSVPMQLLLYGVAPWASSSPRPWRWHVRARL
jgi:hypothetical protein